MSEPVSSPIPPAGSKRLGTLIAILLTAQLRRFRLDAETEAVLFDLVEYGAMAGLGSHWLAPVVRQAVAKAKRDKAKADAPKVSDAEERL